MDFRPEEFEVDLFARRVLHKPSGIWFQFYEYQDEADWQRSDSVMYRDNPDWRGDRGELAALAKRAGIERGMKARRPTAA
jgi:hypothetical protein